MILKRWARLAGALAFCLAACTPTAATGTATSAATAPPIVPSTLTPPTGTPAPTIMTLWVPPFLAPDTNTGAGALLAERLQAFETAHPGVRLEVRTKETSGPSGLLETLRAASVVAPASLPDLIALGPGDLSAAALEDRIVPYPGPLPAPIEGAWYGFALESATAAGTRYGLPSAGQADVLVYDTATYGRGIDHLHRPALQAPGRRAEAIRRRAGAAGLHERDGFPDLRVRPQGRVHGGRAKGGCGVGVPSHLRQAPARKVGGPLHVEIADQNRSDQRVERSPATRLPHLADETLQIALRLNTWRDRDGECRRQQEQRQESNAGGHGRVSEAVIVLPPDLVMP